MFAMMIVIALSLLMSTSQTFADTVEDTYKPVFTRSNFGVYDKVTNGIDYKDGGRAVGGGWFSNGYTYLGMVTNNERHVVVELDPSGKRTWAYSLPKESHSVFKAVKFGDITLIMNADMKNWNTYAIDKNGKLKWKKSGTLLSFEIVSGKLVFIDENPKNKHYYYADANGKAISKTVKFTDFYVVNGKILDLGVATAQHFTGGDALFPKYSYSVQTIRKNGKKLFDFKVPRKGSKIYRNEFKYNNGNYRFVMTNAGNMWETGEMPWTSIYGVDSKGKVLWEFKEDEQFPNHQMKVRDFQVNKKGETLFTLVNAQKKGTLVKLDAKGKLMWTFTPDFSKYAKMTSNKILWGQNFLRVFADDNVFYHGYLVNGKTGKPIWELDFTKYNYSTLRVATRTIQELNFDSKGNIHILQDNYWDNGKSSTFELVKYQLTIKK